MRTATQEKIEAAREEGWSEKDIKNGYAIVECGGGCTVIDGTLMVEAIGELGMMEGDWEACRMAEKDGIKFINDMDGLEKGCYVDTPENRAHCAMMLKKYPEYRIENLIAKEPDDWKIYLEHFNPLRDLTREEMDAFEQHTFFSLFDDIKIHNGKRFRVVNEASESEVEREATGRQFVIQFEDGLPFSAWEDEIDGTQKEQSISQTDSQTKGSKNLRCPNCGTKLAFTTCTMSGNSTAVECDWACVCGTSGSSRFSTTFLGHTVNSANDGVSEEPWTAEKLTKRIFADFKEGSNASGEPLSVITLNAYADENETLVTLRVQWEQDGLAKEDQYFWAELCISTNKDVYDHTNSNDAPTFSSEGLGEKAMAALVNEVLSFMETFDAIEWLATNT